MSKVLQERGSGSLPSSTKINPKDQVKSILTTEEADIPIVRRIEPNRYDVSSLQKDKKMQMVKSATSLKRLIKEKTRIKEEIKATMNVHYSAIIKDDLPSKEKYPGSFTLPCKINNMCFDKGLAEFRASISFMPYSNFTNLGLDFIVLDIPEDIKIPLILGRPFLSTAHAKIDVFCHTPKRGLNGIRVWGRDVIIYITQDQGNDY
ncbi:hypothetical protein Tco_0044879 [Tanacetum coccineum]